MHRVVDNHVIYIICTLNLLLLLFESESKDILFAGYSAVVDAQFSLFTHMWFYKSIIVTVKE